MKQHDCKKTMTPKHCYMKTFLLTCLLIGGLFAARGQQTYYWVGGAGPASFTTASNWNTALDGSGAGWTTPATNDVLIFNGSNIGGGTPATGMVTVNITAITIGQLKLVSNANVVFTRVGGTTGTVTLSNSVAGDDLVIEAGSSLSLNSATANGNVQLQMGGSTGRVSGSLSVANTGQQRIVSAAAPAGSLVFTNGSKFTANVTSSSSSYPFGSNSQSTEKWVVFEAGASLYYEGGWSPMGNNSAFSAINFLPGSNWYHRSGATAGFGSFFNTKSFGNIIVENNATLTADGPIYRVGNLTINNGSAFTTHTSGQTAVLGNLTVEGSLSAPTGSSNTLVMAGNAPQTISGDGAITLPSLVVADNAEVILDRSITINTSANVFGKLNFNGHQILGAGTFTSRANNTAAAVSGNLVAGSYQITNTTGATLSNLNGLSIAGNGIAPNTSVVGFSGSNNTINLSAPITTSGTAVALAFSSDTAVLATSNANGFDSTSGSVVVTGTKSYQPGTSYVINAATNKPFGISSGSTGSVSAGVVTFNAAATTNASVTIYGGLQLNTGKVTLRPLDTLRIRQGAFVGGNIGGGSYVVTAFNAAGEQGVFRYDGIGAAKLFPIGTPNYYAPVTIAPTASSDFTAAVFEGITNEGIPNGTQLSAAQKKTKVDAVWNLGRISGTGNAAITLHWNQSQEGSTFTTLPDADLGIIVNTHPGWAAPVGSGNNTANTASSSFGSFGAFGVGARPPAQSFTFNPLPAKTYGAVDFDGGAFSLNTTEPIIYTSSDPAVATIVNGNIHITGTGTTDITASQASDGFYPPASVTQQLTVNKATLTIRADDKSKPEGDPNPPLTVTYTGFVYGETAAVLTTPVSVSTTAVTNSPAGQYPITPSGATAVNYDIVFVNGTLTVSPRQTQTITFPALPAKTYGNANFAAGATSTNSTIPITYASSNTNVATIVGNNIRIVGAGTATITASQAGSALYFPAQSVSRTVTVSKANLTVRATDTVRGLNAPNPEFRITYTGFVNGDNAGNLTTQPTASTTATPASPPGYYPITLGGSVSSNYNFVYTNGRLTVLPATGTTETYIQAYLSNPNRITVKVYMPEPDLADVVLYSISGQPMQKKNVFLPQGFITFDLPVSASLNGTYVVYVYGRRVQLKKVINIIR